MKALLLARRLTLELLREPKLAAVLLLLPLGFVLVAAASYQAPIVPTYPVLQMCADAVCHDVVAALAEERKADGRPAFEIQRAVDAEQAEAALRSGDAVMFVLTRVDADGSTGLAVRGDGARLEFSVASAVVERVYGAMADARDGRPRVELTTAGLAPVEPHTVFDSAAPGLFVFAILMIIPWTAMVITREARQGTLRRLRLTRLSAFGYLGGVTLYMMVIALIQVAVVFLAALAAGFHSQGSSLVAVLAALLLALGGVGLGLVVASFTRNDSEAGNIGGAVMMVQVFLSGAMFPMPAGTLFILGGHEMGIWDVFPATHALTAMRQVLLYGASVSEVGFRLVAGLSLSALLFAAGVGLFHRLHMRATG